MSWRPLAVKLEKAADALDRQQAIIDAAWLVRTEERDYTPAPDLALRAQCRDRLHLLLDEWHKAAEAAKGKGA